jgi:hypothetical protein
MPTISGQSAPIATKLYRLYGFAHKDAPRSGNCSVEALMVAEIVATFAAWLRRQAKNDREPRMQGGK